MNTFITVLDSSIDFHKPFESASDALSYGIPTSLLGFATVFLVLILLYVVVSLMKVFFYTIPNKNKISTDKKQAKVIEEKKVVVETTLQNDLISIQNTNENEVVAAIIAAIEAYRTQNGTLGGFRVVSFKKRK